MRDWSIPDLNLGLGCAVSDSVPFNSTIDLEYTALASGGLYLLSFGNTASFRVCFQSKVIELISASTDDPVTAAHLLYDHVIPRVLSAEVPLVLHGSLVRIGSSLAVFTGETGAGKSTLGASLDAKGYPLLGDDAVIVTEQDGVFYGEAVYPSLRLYPDSIASVLGDDVGTAPMAHYSDKQHVTNFRDLATTPGPLPIGCIFAVSGGSEAPQLRSLSVREICMAMIDQSFALDPDDVDAAAARMGAAARLASAVPGFALRIPHDYARLPQVHTLIAQCVADSARSSLPQGHAR